MKNEIKEKQLNEVLYGLDYIGNKIKNDDGKLELGVNNCKILLDYITNLQEDIKKYVDVVLYQRQTIDNLQKELERYKNIIDELEKWLKEQQKEVFHIGDKIGIVDSVSIDLLLDKLRELKGSDCNE
jgi:flagellar biosynthesis chaperone FliJ